MTGPLQPAVLASGRRLPGNAETLGHALRAVELQPGQRVLLVGAGAVDDLALLAKEWDAKVTALEWDPHRVAALEARVRDEPIGGQVTVRQGRPEQMPAAAFDAVLLACPPPPGHLTPFARTLRGLLDASGKLVLTLPAAVGFAVPRAAKQLWSEELGFELCRPVELLGFIERAGFEPLWAEALADEVVAEHYRELEVQLGELADPALEPWASRQRQAIELFRDPGGRAGVNFVTLGARRREPGEKPPPARTAG